MTQEELGERSTVAVRTIRRLETEAAANPRMGTVKLLADALASALSLSPDTMREVLAGAPAEVLGLKELKEDGPQPPPVDPDPPSASWAPRDALDDTADKLARQVRERWQREEEIRRINDPFPLPVRWEQAKLVDHWENVRGTRSEDSPDGAPFDGKLGEIADAYRKVPSGRLVVLGRAGSGKTILTLRFVLDYLSTRRAGEPVPVIFSIGSWDPTAMTLRDWLTHRLLRDYPDLAAPADSRQTQAAALVADERVLPVLDGFDEIATGLHEHALEALNATSLRLVLTSRSDEYARAAALAGALTRAAGIELCDLTPDDLADYLPRATRRTAPGTDPRGDGSGWAPVLAKLRDDPGGPASISLAAALSTPLMVALARAVYSDRPGQDPEALLDTERFPTRVAIEEHLLASFVPTVYRHRPQPGVPQGRRHRNWDPGRARHWLGHLARHLEHVGDRDNQDLAWWRLGTQLRPSVRILAVVVATTLATALADWLVVLPLDVLQAGIPFGIKAGLLDGVVSGPPVGIAFGLIYGFLTAYDRGTFEPTRVRLRLPTWRRGAGGTREQRYVTWGGAGFLGGLVVGAGYGPARTLTVRLLYGLHLQTGLVVRATLIDMLCFGLIFGLAGGIGLGLVTLLETPIDTGTAATPMSLLISNRATALRQLLVTAPVLAVMIGFGGWGLISLLQPLLGPLTWSLQAGIVIGAVGGLSGALSYILAFTAWGQWLVLSRVALPLTGRLPWTPLAFLDGAYQRGVLRQAGAVYQFRHVRLQRHLSQVP
jgi:transcriptional regulator with XRE-family HTH domain